MVLQLLAANAAFLQHLLCPCQHGLQKQKETLPDANEQKPNLGMGMGVRCRVLRQLR